MRNLTVNETKTEEYTIARQGDESWKKCKLLGSLLSTSHDITRRKSLAMSAIENMKSIFNGKVSLSVKLRAFECYVAAIFLYNSELWTLTSTLEKAIDSFQRRLLRTACLNAKWPKKISNHDLYEITKAAAWSKTIRKRQLSWFGHLSRMKDDTPAKLALSYVRSAHILRPKGRPPTTWISMMNSRLKECGKSWDEADEMARDRKKWQGFIKSCCDNW